MSNPGRSKNPAGHGLVTAILVILLASAGRASAAGLTLNFEQGLVTVYAQNVSIREILQEWAKLRGVTLVNGDRLPEGPVSFELDKVTERSALETILRSVSGYVMTRAENAASGATIDRILIGPVAAAAPAVVVATAASPPNLPAEPPSAIDTDNVVNSRNGAVEISIPTARVTAPGQGQSAAFGSIAPATAMAPSNAARIAVGANPFGIRSGTALPGEIMAVPLPPPAGVLQSPSGHLPGDQTTEPPSPKR